jgi:predicted ATP-grasp superfamily ATP-dependent carboligase
MTRVSPEPLAGIRAIVTDAETRLGLHVIRGLGRVGCSITALTQASRGPAVGFSSRYTTSARRLVGPYAEALTTALDDLAPTHDVVVPVTSHSVSLLADQPDRFVPTLRRYIPSAEAFHVASSKAETIRVARSVGIPVPDTYEGLDPATVEDWARTSKVSFPLVVKFADDSHTGHWSPGERYRIVHTIGELGREFRRMHHVGPYPLVQEFVAGDGYGFFAITDSRGEPVATFCHHRLREYPIRGGPSTLCESVYDETLIELGTRLLRRLCWRGVAMVEFKRDRCDGRYKLMEINPRYWGSMPLALMCGLNFPQYQVEMALGRCPTPPKAYPVGKRMRFLFSDIRAIVDLARGDRSAATLLEYVRELCDLSIKDGLLQGDDPRPVFTYLYNHLRR